MRAAVFYGHIVHAAQERGASIEETLAWARSLGFEGVEVDGDRGYDADELADMLERTGMACSSIYSIYSWNEDPQDLHGLAHLELAEKLGARFVMPIPGFYTSDDPAVRAQELERMVAGMAALTDEALARGIQPVIEDYDLNTSPISTIAGMQAFTDAIPGLMVALDTGNFRYSAEDVLDAYDAFRPRIRHAHLKDRLLVPEVTPELDRLQGKPLVALDGQVMYSCAVGSGQMPIAQVLERLAADGYDGWVTAEFFNSADYTPAIERSAAWLADRLG